MLWSGIAIAALFIGLTVGYAVGSSRAGVTASPTPSSSATADRVHTTSAPSPRPGTTSGATSVPAQPEDPIERARRTLEALPVVEGRSASRYFRDAFGEAWYDVDGNGCRTRDDILRRDLVNPEFKPGTRDCKVLSGVLTDPYSGAVADFVFGFDTSQLVPVDHIVALAWAWRHGAESWSPERRLEFANDPINLVATTKEMNDEKLDHGPSEWVPPVASLRCDYIVKWVGVLDAYDLGVGSADKAAAAGVLETC
jgi:hypothetical protein